MTFFTNHDYTYHNINIIYINPLLFAAVPLGILYARGSRGGRFPPERLLRILWAYVFLGGALTLALRLLPGFYQQNQVTLALVLPFAFTLGFLTAWVKAHSALTDNV
jgi:hypothetical protein